MNILACSCPVCGAPAGAPCTTGSGVQRTIAHRPREEAAIAATRRDWTQLYLSRTEPCAFCGVEAGQPCRSNSTRLPLPNIHARRLRAAGVRHYAGLTQPEGFYPLPSVAVRWEGTQDALPGLDMTALTRPSSPGQTTLF